MILTIIVGAAIFAAVSTQAASSANDNNWLSFGASPTFEAGDLACENGLHRTLRRDWRGDWLWGPCVKNR